MVFSSPRFLLFLAAVLAGLALTRNREVKKRLLAAASCFFYAAWDWRYLGLLLFISVVDYWAAARIKRSAVSRTRRAWLWLSIGSNLGLLAYFKYCNFFLENANQLFGVMGLAAPRLDILLPAGISFYTFKTMSYTIDVYRGQLEPCKSWMDYVTFVTFFPELIAGPIVRASVFLPQMGRSIGPTSTRLAEGGSLFLIGLTKKLLIADRMAPIADAVFAAPSVYSAATVWAGVLAYSLQIYCDFSGYSDMAIGTARMIGYDLPENFNMPYAATSIADFWHRWHITLSQWLRDYLYIPLGGNRHGSLATYRNLLLTMLLGGLWHGASWNFVIWGGLHGLALSTHRFWSTRRPAAPSGLRWPGRIATLLFVVVAWVPFRAPTLESSVVMLRQMFFPGAGGVEWIPTWLCIALVLTVAAHGIGARLGRDATPRQDGRPVSHALRWWFGLKLVVDPLAGPFPAFSRVTVLGAYLLCLTLLSLLLFGSLNTSPFIYFQF